ncbi:MAG: hypothetical protein WCL13_01570 [bacterium]
MSFWSAAIESCEKPINDEMLSLPAGRQGFANATLQHDSLIIV